MMGGIRAGTWEKVLLKSLSFSAWNEDLGMTGREVGSDTCFFNLGSCSIIN